MPSSATSTTPSSPPAPAGASPPRRCRAEGGTALRILLVIDSLDLGGAERHVVELACELARRGHEPVVACSRGGRFAEPLRAAGVPVQRVAPAPAKRRFSARYALGLRRLVANGSFDLVHAHLHASATAAAAALIGSPVPLVITEQTEAPWRGRRARLAARLAHRRATQSIAVSARIAEGLAERERVPGSRLHQIPNTVARDPAPAPRRPGAPVVGAVARLQPEKGLDHFLRAAALVAAADGDARFVLIGEGPLRDELDALAVRLGIADRVSFLGGRPDARDLLASFDVLAMSSIAEGTPLTIIEAMQAGIPVVATRAGGIPDQIRDGVDGLLVEPRDFESLAAAILRVLGDPDLAAALGRSGRRRAQTEFSHGRMVDRVLAVYRRALAAPEAVPDQRGGARVDEPFREAADAAVL